MANFCGFEAIGVDSEGALFATTVVGVSVGEEWGELAGLGEAEALDLPELPPRGADSRLGGAPEALTSGVEGIDSAPLGGLAISVPGASSEVVAEDDSPVGAAAFAVAELEAVAAGIVLAGRGGWDDWVVCSMR